MSAFTVIVILLSLVVIGSAVAVVTLRNLFHCGLALGLCFTGVAGIYLTLSAPFLAASQVLIYVGAITVLILFAIMLTQEALGGPQTRVSSQWGWSLLAAAALWAFLLYRIPSASWPSFGPALQPNGDDSARVIGEQLLTTYLLPFEAASLLLLAAMAGAIVIAKEESAREPGFVPEPPAPVAETEEARR